MTQKRRRGRPAWKPTKADRAKAKTLLAMGTSVPAVAAILRVDGKTLRKHLADEIRTAMAEANAQVLMSLFRAATDRDRPNVRAMRAWAEIRGLFPVAARATESAAAGKKVARQAAARKVARSGRFAPGQAPKLIVDNTKPRSTGSDDEPRE